MHWMRFHCPECGHGERCGPDQTLRKVQAVGVLRREEEPDWELIRELLPGAAGQMTCASCGRLGLAVEAAEDDWDERPFGAAARACERCGERIPPERLELFPDSVRCAKCQDASDGSLEEDDFCPYCGGRVHVRPASRSGVTRYVSVCSDCGK